MNKALNNKHKKPWPTSKAMEQVYEQNLWGGDTSEFYSGEGSHQPELVKPYVAAVRDFLISFKNPITVCDLGCGDFNIGKQLYGYAKEYIAVDIVEGLIFHNKKVHQATNLTFLKRDIAVDNLPPAECVIIRQVLQHLSNAEVKSTLNNLKSYKYIILTEHIPDEDFTPNLDIISGQGIRLKKGSGIDILKPPFNFNVKSIKKLLSIYPKDGIGAIVTTLYSL